MGAPWADRAYRPGAIVEVVLPTGLPGPRQQHIEAEDVIEDPLVRHPMHAFGFSGNGPALPGMTSEGASAVRKGSPQIRPIHADGASSMTLTQRSPLALTK